MIIIPNLIEIIKQSALDVVKETSPTEIIFGEVKSIKPLVINIEQRLTIDEDHLILTRLVRDFDVDIEGKFFTEESRTKEIYNHEIKGEKKIKIKLSLKVGESVLMLRVQGGQKYIVLDRIRNDTKT